jgi:hypothetical protein
MGVRWLLAGVLAVALLAGCGDDASGDPTPESAAAGKPLDCGQGKRGSKAAVRRFFAVLRSGDERRVLRALATGGRFEWIWVADKSGDTIVDVRGGHQRRAAAAAVADYGGLPLRVGEFQNIDRPSRTMDFGYRGTWRGRGMIGKGALDCRQGRARVLTVGLPFDVKR